MLLSVLGSSIEPGTLLGSNSTEIRTVLQIINSPAFTIGFSLIVAAAAAVPILNYFSHRREEKRREREVLAAEKSAVAQVEQAAALHRIAECIYTRSVIRKR